MVFTYEENSRLLTIAFEGEIDHHSCLEITHKTDDTIRRYLPSTVIFDFDKVTFMDSSGIGMLLGRYKKLIRIGATSTMRNVHGDMKRIFMMSGIFKIIPIVEEVTTNG